MIFSFLWALFFLNMRAFLRLSLIKVAINFCFCRACGLVWVFFFLFHFMHADVRASVVFAPILLFFFAALFTVKTMRDKKKSSRWREKRKELEKRKNDFFSNPHALWCTLFPLPNNAEFHGTKKNVENGIQITVDWTQIRRNCVYTHASISINSLQMIPTSRSYAEYDSMLDSLANVSLLTHRFRIQRTSPFFRECLKVEAHPISFKPHCEHELRARTHLHTGHCWSGFLSLPGLLFLVIYSLCEELRFFFIFFSRFNQLAIINILFCRCVRGLVAPAFCFVLFVCF